MQQQSPAIQQPSSAERAQGLVEYGLIIALVALIAIAGLIILGPAIRDMFSNMQNSV